MKETIRKMLKIKTRERGITLMVLVVTILVLLILAAVTTKLVLGEGGILGETKEAVNEWDKTTEGEKSDLAKLAQEMKNARNGTSENQVGSNEIGGGETGGDTESKKPIGEITGEEKTNTETEDKEGNPITVPAGFKIVNPEVTVNEGIVIEDISGGSEDTVGNQFVWIPCTLDGARGTLKYDRHAFTRESPTWSYRQSLVLGTNGEYEKDSDGSYMIKFPGFSTPCYYHEAMPEVERASIEKYGGYYIGRYEVGCDTARTSHTAITATARIKTNLPVYNYVTRDEAVTIAERMYEGKSKLCSSYAWDTALKFIDGESGTYAVNSEGDNNRTTSSSSKLENTGYHEEKNIYDMGGNVYEWTSEAYTHASHPCVFRRWLLLSYCS